MPIGCRSREVESGKSRAKRKEEKHEASPLFSGPVQTNYFLGGAMTSLAALATRNLTTVLALILMAWPVCGLRPMRALRSAFTRRPIPGITKTPFFLVSLMAVSASRSRKAADCLLVSSSFSAICRVRAVLVNPVAMYFLLLGARCGPPVLPGFARRSGSFPMEESRIRNRMAGVQPEATSARMPCVHAGFENPFVAYNATSDAVKSMGKGRFPQDLCCFFRFLPIFSYFLRFLAEFHRVFR